MKITLDIEQDTEGWWGITVFDGDEPWASVSGRDALGSLQATVPYMAQLIYAQGDPLMEMLDQIKSAHVRVVDPNA